VQPLLLTAEVSILSNSLSTADVPTAPTASRSVDSVQAQPKCEQALEDSMLESELRRLRESADLYKSQRDEAWDALQKQANKQRGIREDYYEE
jgi:hypothetical protein